MMAAPTHDPICTLTLTKRRDGRSAPWEIQCEGESLGGFASLSEALATARTMAANWLGEADIVRVTGGDPTAVVVDESYSRLPQRADNDAF